MWHCENEGNSSFRNSKEVPDELKSGVLCLSWGDWRRNRESKARWS